VSPVVLIAIGVLGNLLAVDRSKQRPAVGPWADSQGGTSRRLARIPMHTRMDAHSWTVDFEAVYRGV